MRLLRPARSARRQLTANRVSVGLAKALVDSKVVEAGPSHQIEPANRIRSSMMPKHMGCGRDCVRHVAWASLFAASNGVIEVRLPA